MGLGGQVQRTVDSVVLYDLMALSANEKASPQSRATALAKLAALRDWSNGQNPSDPGLKAFYQFAFGPDPALRNQSEGDWNPQARRGAARPAHRRRRVQLRRVRSTIEDMPEYREIAPPPGLAHMVECFWTGRASPGEPPYRVMPDGCADILFTRSGGGIRLDAVGPMTVYRDYDLSAGTRLAGDAAAPRHVARASRHSRRPADGLRAAARRPLGRACPYPARSPVPARVR